MKTHITKELALWLKERGCEVETKLVYWRCSEDGWEVHHDSGQFTNEAELLPAYTYYDILVAHAKEFWGDAYIYNKISQMVILLQQNKIEEAEGYIMKHSVFANQNQ